MAAFNQIELIGNMGKDPELNVTQEGTPVTKFSMCVNRYMGKDKSTGETITKDYWWNVTCWRQVAEYVERYAHKGSLVFITGEFWPRNYTDKSGVERTSLDITALKVVLLDRKSNGTNGSEKDFLPDEL